jgi:hypothetical protein
LGAIPIPVPAGAEETGLSAPVDTLPVFWPEPAPHKTLNFDYTDGVLLVLNPARRRAYQLFFGPDVRFMYGKLGIRGIDLDTLRPDRYFELSREQMKDGSGWNQPVRRGSASGEWLYALDDEGGMLYLALKGGSGPKIAAIDLRVFDRGANPYRTLPLMNSLTASGAPQTMSFFRDPAGKAKLLFGLAPKLGSQAGARIRQIDVASWSQDPVNGGWETDVGNSKCTSFDLGGDGINYYLPLWRSPTGKAIYAVCKLDTKGGAVVVRLPLDEAGEPPLGVTAPVSDFVRPVSDAIADPASDRVFLMQRSTQLGAGSSLWTYDAAKNAYVGTVGIFRASVHDYALGVDGTTGRIYVLGPDYIEPIDSQGQKFRAQPGGIFSFDGRLTPTPQALQFPELAYLGGTRIQVDPATAAHPRRVFLRRGRPAETRDCYHYPSTKYYGNECLPEDYWMVLEDQIPVARQPSLSDVDRFTQGVKEHPGRTDRTFNASGGAYGTRVRMLGGFEAALTRGPQGEDELNNIMTNQSFGGARPMTIRSRPACWPNDRELFAGRVADVSTTPDEATATASYLQADPQSKRDIEKPGSRCAPPNQDWLGRLFRDDLHQEEVDQQKLWATADHAGKAWDQQDVTCSGDTTDAKEAQSLFDLPFDKKTTGHDFAAGAQCIHSKHQASAQAAGTAFDPGKDALVRIGSNHANVDVAPLKDGGIRVRSEAEVRDIQIGPYTIGRVHTLATSEAAGRKGTAGASFVREICDLEGPNVETERGCVDEKNPNVQTFLKEFNDRMGNYAQISLGSYDRALLKGSPGGYIAAVQKEEAKAYNDELVYRDPLHEVVGLEITLKRDGTDIGREIIQLAGVRAATTYATYLLPSGGEGFISDVDLPAIVPEIGSLPVSAPVGTGTETPSGGLGSAAPSIPGYPVPQAGTSVHALLVRSLAEGLFTSAAWFVIGLPLYLGSRRKRLAISAGRETA